MDVSFWTQNATDREKDLLRGEIIRKLKDVGAPNQDESLADYILVLLANKHPLEKIVKELEDFLSAQLSQPFVEWLLGCAFEIIKQKEIGNFPPQQQQTIVHAGEEQQQQQQQQPFEPVMEVEMEPKQEEKKRQEGRNFTASNRQSNQNNRGPRRGDERQSGRHQRRSTSRDIYYHEDNRFDRSERPRRSDRLRRVGGYNGDDDDRLSRRSSGDRYSSRSRIGDARELIGRDNRGHGHVVDEDDDVSDDGNHNRRRRHTRVGNEGGAGRASSLSSGGGKEEKCRFWPNCKEGDDGSCPYVHPSKKCEHFPLCSFGNRCLFIHPQIPCKYQLRCQNPSCNYQHTVLAGGSKSNVNIPCKFHPNCRNTGCPFLHPIDSECRFGKECNRPSCPFKHVEERIGVSKTLINEPCKFGSKCSKVDCAYKHDRNGDDVSMEMTMMVQSPVNGDSSSIAQLE